MLKSAKRIAIAAAIILVAIQAYRPERTNPASNSNQEIQGMLAVDAQTSQVLDRACRDCHTNRTVWPWYSQVAPASWLVVFDVRRGRAALNLSEWGKYAPEQRQKHLKEMCSAVAEGEMPAMQYTWMHPEARLSAADKAALCSWTKGAAGSRSEPILQQ